MAIDRGENPVRARGAELLRRSISWAVRWVCAWVWIVLPSHSHATEGQSGIADGALNACVLLDIDRAFAVGDRGLILRSEDGGKSWSSIGNRGTHTYFAIGFDAAASLGDSPRSGLIVGGRIDLVTGRSEGIVELSQDDGKTWARNSTVALPRLLGLQQLEHRRWIAWGDWSDHWQSSLFETMDGGKTWSARPTPSGHLRCASVDNLGRTMIIDRTGAVFFSNDGMEFHPSAMVIDPFRPLRFCKACSQGWWVGGDNGQLFFSQDGMQWTRVSLPGNESDHDSMHFRDAAIQGSRIWLIGMPGSVVWHSKDGGANWRVSSTHHAAGLQAIHALDENILMTCGDFGRIQLSRNSGIAWIDCHQSGSRVACQSIASTEQTIPWDLMAYVVHESQRRTGTIVVHQQDLQGGRSHRPEAHERVAEVGRQIGLESAVVLTEFPVGNLRTGIRSTDLGYYQTPDPIRSDLIRKLVLEIRCLRPDVIVVEDTSSKHSLTAATAVATQQAIRLAASPNYRCFSQESGIEIPEWNCQRVLLRGEESGGLTFAPTMLLNASGMLLSEAMHPSRFLDENELGYSNPISIRSTYRISTQRTVSIKHPLDGMILDRETRLIETRSVKRKMSSLVAASNAPARIAQASSTRGAGVWVENAWDDALVELGKELPNDVLIPCLWGAAVDSRRIGNWHRWNSALNMIIEKDGEGPMAERAFHELMTYFGSAEVHRIIQDQWIALDAAKKGSSRAPASTTSAHSSPFSTGSSVALANFDSAARVTSIAKLRGMDTFSRLLSRWPEAWQPRRAEPEWAWLIASRYRSRALIRGTPLEDRKDSVFWPPQHPGLSGWTQLLAQEQQLITKQPMVTPSTSIPWINSRPFLDGRDEESCWKDESVMELASTWSEDGPKTQIRIARDADFLFIHSRSWKSPNGLNASLKGKATARSNPQRTRDSLDTEKDHIRFRLDLDRDYSTWFELAWDSDGETLDQCNDMSWWNPEWFIAVTEDHATWSAEIAIPMASLIPTPPSEFTAMPRQASDAVTLAAKPENRSVDVDSIRWDEQTWGMSFVREIPSSGLQSAPMCDADRWSRERWFLAFPQQARSSQSEQPAQLSNSPTGFAPAKR